MHLSFYRHTKNLNDMHISHFYRLTCSSMYGLIDAYTKIYHGKVLFLMFNWKEDILSYVKQIYIVELFF